LVVGVGFAFQDFAAEVEVGGLGQAANFIVVAGGGDAIGMSQLGDSAVGPAGVGSTGGVGAALLIRRCQFDEVRILAILAIVALLFASQRLAPRCCGATGSVALLFASQRLAPRCCGATDSVTLLFAGQRLAPREFCCLSHNKWA
jgi:hypothetical protein